MASHLEPAAVDHRTWAIVEVMGHSSYGGVIREVERLGAKFLEVTVLATDRNLEFQVTLSAAAIFRMTKVTESVARKHYSSIPDGYRIELPLVRRISHEIVGADAATCIDELDDDRDDLQPRGSCRGCGDLALVGELDQHAGFCSDCTEEQYQ